MARVLALAAATFLTGAGAFQLTPRLAPARRPAAQALLRPAPALLRAVPRAARAVAPVQMSAGAPEAAEMDERIYKFNKVVIDTVGRAWLVQGAACCVCGTGRLTST